MYFLIHLQLKLHFFLKLKPPGRKKLLTICQTAEYKMLRSAGITLVIVCYIKVITQEKFDETKSQNKILKYLIVLINN